jgi:hypothetical protein
VYGNTSNDFGYNIATDASGNSYVTGTFNGTVSFGSTSLTSTSNTDDIFVLKIDTNGNLLWVQQIVGDGTDRVRGIAFDNSGNSYLTGSFTGVLTFGAATITADGTDIFTIKLDNLGAVVWAFKAGGTGADAGLDIAVDASGNAYITGTVGASPTFVGTLGSISPSGSGLGEDMFYARYNTNGSLAWVRLITSNSNEVGLGIAVANSGNIYLTGRFRATLNFGGTSLTTLSGSDDIFVVKYDLSTGTLQWVVQAGGNVNNDAGNDISLDNLENVYITGLVSGAFATTVTFGTGGGAVSFMPNAVDIFVAQYDVNGNFTWVRSGGSSGNDVGISIVTHPSGVASYVVGQLDNGAATFGSLPSITSSALDGFLGIIGSTLLPIEWLFFKGQKNENNTLLSWATATEKNNDFFAVERSKNGIDFQQIGKVNSKGNSQQPQYYQFIDDFPHEGTNYYRLKQQDFDGKYNFSKTIAIHTNQDSPRLSIYPNPSTDVFSIQIHHSSETLTDIKNYDLQVINAFGQVVHQQTYTYNDGNTLIDLTNHQRGYYLLKISFQNQVFTYKHLLQ